VNMGTGLTHMGQGFHGHCESAQADGIDRPTHNRSSLHKQAIGGCS
jgi:hypothetical protein